MRYFSPNRTYDGNISQTRDGLECQMWSSQSPHEHSFTPEQWPNSLGDHNKCREPEQKWLGAWCYTTSADTRWDYCDCGSEQGTPQATYFLK